MPGAPCRLDFRIADDFPRSFISPWSRALFVAVDRPRYTFLDLLSDPKYVREVRSVEKDGKRLYQVNLVTPLGNDLETWVDPDRNFLVTKTIWFGVHKGEHEPRIEQNVAAFEQVAPGVYFPKEINASLFQPAPAGKESLVQTTRTRFSSIKINEDFASTVFKLTIPIGARVVDNIEGITYQMGPGGKPLLGNPEAGVEQPGPP